MKQDIINAIDKNANEETRNIALSLTEDEAMKLHHQMSNFLNSRNQSPAPFVTILELKRFKSEVSYKLNCLTQIWGNASL